jgi:magnesium transporter
MITHNGAKLGEIQDALLAPRGLAKPMEELYHPADIAAAIGRIGEKSEMLRAFGSLSVKLRPEILSLLDASARGVILENAVPETLAEIIGGMNTDDAADVLGEMREEKAGQVLDASREDVEKEVSRLLEFGPKTAGGIMQTELFSAREEMTLDEALVILRSRPDISRGVYNMFVVDSRGRLKGVVPIIELLLNPGETKIAAIMDESHPPLYARANDDQENVARIFKKYDLISLAVVDKEMNLLGRILIDDIVDVMEEEADEDIMKMAGARDEALSRAASTMAMARYRLPWLAASLGGGFVTGSLIWAYKGTLESIMALATFIPIVMGMSGNVGSQSSTLIIRGISTGRLEAGALREFLIREFKVALLLGLCCALAAGGAAAVWRGSPELGLIVGGSIFLAINLAALMGTFIPLLFRWIKVDPAVAGGPIVLALNDVTALLIFLSVATFLIHLLQ